MPGVDASCSYAELIQNRAFQGSRTFPSTLAPWTAVGRASLALDRTNPLSSALPVSVRVTKGRDSAAVIGLKNPGWWGIDVKANTTYSGSFYARGAYAGNFTMRLQSDITGEELASTTIPSKSRADSWTKHEFQFVPPASAKNSNNSFILQFSPGQGAVMNFNLISLFPPTYNGRCAAYQLKAINPLPIMHL